MYQGPLDHESKVAKEIESTRLYQGFKKPNKVWNPWIILQTSLINSPHDPR